MHRFIVERTIEEKIHHVLSSLPNSADSGSNSQLDDLPMTLADLAEIFNQASIDF